jgi:regulator of protease activity HflC (stomatin/prohibitin superfamily)
MSIGKIAALVFGAFFLAFVLVVAFGSWHIVPPGHRGVAVTMGSTNPQPRLEGITGKMPLLTTIHNMPIKQITVEGMAPAFSSDLQQVNVKFNVLYRIPEEQVVSLFQKYSGNPYESLVLPRVQEVIKQQTALHRAEEIVKMREKIKVAVLPKLQEVVKEVVIVDVVINNIDLTKELEKAIELKQVMEQQALAKTYELQKAQKEAEITVVGAKAEAEAVKIKGEALKASPEVIQLEIAKKWNGVTPQYVSTTEGGANVLLPLQTRPGK